MGCNVEWKWQVGKHQWWSWSYQMMNHKHITEAKPRARIQDNDIYEIEMN